MTDLEALVVAAYVFADEYRVGSGRASLRIWAAIAGSSPRPCATPRPRNGAELRSRRGEA